jgi:predicted NAD/FAD-dependent oxidoreductase
MTQRHVAIVGAGLSGLELARQLTNAGVSTTLFDKSRGVSGRVATRRAEVAGHTLRFDHGTPGLTECQAEKISSLTMPTQLALEPWLPPSAMTGNKPHFSLASGMNGIGKWLAQGQSIALNAPVTALRESCGGKTWQIESESTLRPQNFDLVITTTPPLQAANILKATQTPMIEQLNTMRPEGCWSLMLVTEHPWDIAPLLTPHDSLIERVISEHTKGRLSNTWGVYTIQAHRAWSQRHMDEDPTLVCKKILSELDRLGFGRMNIVYHRMHRWLYAGVAEPLGEAILLDTQRKLMCAGDWCLGNDVTSALKSADAAWSAAIELLS